MVAQDDILAIPKNNAPLDQARIKQDSTLKYPYLFWGSYKHHVRGLLAGVVLGAAIGAAIGFVALACAPAIGLLGVLAFAGAGLLFGAEQVGSIGTASGARASGLAESHARALDPVNKGDPEKIANDKLMYDGRGNHYEYPENRDKNKFFSLKSAFAGTFIGAAAGALIGKLAAGLPAIAAIAKVGAIAALGPVAAPVVASAMVFGLLGLSFGIERGIFKSVFNRVSWLTDGKNKKEDLGREQTLGQETDQELLGRRLKRQEDIYKLRTEYDDKIFMSGIKGYVKGVIGGSALGAFFGAALGLLAVGILAAFAPAVAGIGLIVGGFALAGALYGLKTFGESGYNAGAEATARAIDDEFKLEQAQKTGLAPTHSPAPQESQKGLAASTFNALMGGVDKVSDQSTKVYEHVYDNDATVSPEATDAIIKARQKEQSEAVTQADAEKLQERLNSASNKRSFSTMIQEKAPTTGAQL